MISLNPCLDNSQFNNELIVISLYDPLQCFTFGYMLSNYTQPSEVSHDSL